MSRVVLPVSDHVVADFSFLASNCVFGFSTRHYLKRHSHFQLLPPNFGVRVLMCR